MAEWIGTGLQNLVQRFNSASRLQLLPPTGAHMRMEEATEDVLRNIEHTVVMGDRAI